MPKSVDKPKDVTVGCKVHKESKKELEKLAEKEDESVSFVVREAIEKYLAERGALASDEVIEVN